MILDYSQNFYSKRIFKERVKDNNKNSAKRSAKKRKLFDNQLDEDLLYKGSIQICPFCVKEMDCIHLSDSSSREDYDFSWSDSVGIFLCLDCGYWSHYQDHEEYNYTEENITKYTRTVGDWRAILKQFEPHSNQIPIDVLEAEIRKNPTLMYQISPYKMEDIVKQVFKDYFNCEVTHCGKSHDGGIDLLILESDNPILVQIKRRENANTVEPINLIRELLGAMFINSSKKGIFVTTANKFSKTAEKIRDELLAKKKLDYFELIDFNRFCDILNLTNKKIKKPWNDFYLDIKDTVEDARRNTIHKHEYFHLY